MNDLMKSTSTEDVMLGVIIALKKGEWPARLESMLESSHMKMPHKNVYDTVKADFGQDQYFYRRKVGAYYYYCVLGNHRWVEWYKVRMVYKRSFESWYFDCEKIINVK